MTFRWTGKRDQALIDARRDGFSYRDAAGLVGGGCTAADAKARMKALRALEQDFKTEEPPSNGLEPVEGMSVAGTAQRSVPPAPAGAAAPKDGGPDAPPPQKSASNPSVSGWSSPEAHQPHKLEVAGSNPAPATSFQRGARDVAPSPDRVAPSGPPEPVIADQCAAVNAPAVKDRAPHGLLPLPKHGEMEKRYDSVISRLYR